ncbi:MAG: O-antigen ligase family protein [Bacteroidales bacterium]|nr:O-antigen ligase family protein [Bacteroidales bacterium]
MTSQASIRPYLNQAYLLGLLMVAVGLTLSPFLMGMSQFWLVLVWLVDGLVGNRDGNVIPCDGSVGESGIYFHHDFRYKLSRFWHNTPAVLLVAFYLLHVVGLLWTSDFEYALKDLRVKLPILVMPFVLSSMEPLDRKRFNLVMLVYVLSVFVATLFSSVSYWRHDYEDIREISHFISHIRFCLNIVFCIAIIGYYIFEMRVSRRNNVPAFGLKVAVNQFLMRFLLFWFVYQIYIFESLSGYVILAVVVIVTLVYAFLQWKKSKGWHIAMAVLASLIVAVAFFVLQHEVKPLLKVEPVDFATLEQKTAQGNDYWHDTIHNPVEDGKYVGLYYCRKELQEAWLQRSGMAFEGTTENGENLEATLARYLTSKGLRKDAQGVMTLTDEDIRNVEQGVANYNNWRHPGLRARLSATLFEYNLYHRYNNPNGGSLAQRIEYTRASFHIIGQHLWFGVGTGDVPQAFAQAYDEIHSPLKEEFRFRAHNQYLAIAVAFGLVGLAFFLFVLLYPWCASRKNHNYLYMAFLTIMLLSMFPEDTLETQAGATLFAFFEALLLFAAPQKSVGDNR